MWPFKKKEKTVVVDKVAVNTRRILTLIEDADIKYTLSGCTDVMECSVKGIRATRYVNISFTTLYEVYVNDIYLKDVEANRVFHKMASIYIDRENAIKRKRQEEQDNKLRDMGLLVGYYDSVVAAEQGFLRGDRGEGRLEDFEGIDTRLRR